MAYTNHTFCWHGVISTDVSKAKAFYTEVLGWKVQEVPMGDSTATLFSVADVPRAHTAPPLQPGVPSHWDNYLRVEDVDACTQAAVNNGGRQLVPPTDIPPGRFSLIASPSGAAVSLFHEADPSSADAPSGPGSIHWVELQSHDLDADVAWMKKTFGLTADEMPMPQGPYYIFKDKETMVGGAMAGLEGAPSMWMSWVEVDDLEATLERVDKQGGKRLSQVMDIQGVGRMAVVQDDTGGAFGVIKPAAR